MTPAQYGTYTTAFTMSLMGAAIAQLGLDRAVVRFVAGAIGSTSWVGAGRDAHGGLVYGVVSAIVAGLILTPDPVSCSPTSCFPPTLALVMPLRGAGG